MPARAGAPEAHHVLVERRKAHAVLDSGHAVHDLREVHLRVPARLGEHVQSELATRHHRQVAALARRLRVVLDSDRSVILVPPELLAGSSQRVKRAVHAHATCAVAVNRGSGGKQARTCQLAGHQHVRHPSIPELIAVDLHHGRDAVGERTVEVRRVLLNHVQRGVVDVGMGMCVHQSGDDCVAGDVEHSRVGRNLHIGSDGRNTVPPDEHRGVLQDLALRVHGNHPRTRQRHRRIRLVDPELPRQIGATRC